MFSHIVLNRAARARSGMTASTPAAERCQYNAQIEDNSLVAQTKHTCWSCAAVFVDVGKQPLACPRCAAVVGVMPEFPATLLDGVAWSLALPKPATEAKLRTQLERYNIALGKPSPVPPALDVVLPTRQVRVTYRFEQPIVVASATGFTAIGLLHAVHGAVMKKLTRYDHTVYEFEGFRLAEIRPDMPPVYSVTLGRDMRKSP